MKYKHHVIACLTLAIISSVIGLNTHRLTLSTLDEFWIGALPYTLVLTCDLDSKTSVVTRALGPFNIFSSFSEFGHREVLHHWVWGPVILIGWWLIPALWVGIKVPEITLVGAVLMLWCHMFCDMVYSSTKRIIPKRIWNMF